MLLEAVGKQGFLILGMNAKNKLVVIKALNIKVLRQ